jgi:hypothetical protein
MTQLSDDCFAFGGALLAIEDGIRRITERVDRVAAAETTALTAADRRIFAEDIIAPIDAGLWQSVALIAGAHAPVIARSAATQQSPARGVARSTFSRCCAPRSWFPNHGETAPIPTPTWHHAILRQRMVRPRRC